MDPKPLISFPNWSNKLALGLLLGLATVPVYAGLLLAYGAHPTTLNVGYAPQQPVPYSHAIHVGKLGLDCRYCHNTVEKAAFAALPPTQTCMNCHSSILTTDPRIQPVRNSWATGKPVEWVKVHNLAQYVYFNHSAHVNHGVGCIECHGRIDRMEQVQQVKPLSMGWCLECHRDPGSHLRPKDVAVTDMNWKSSDDPNFSAEDLLKEYGIHDVAYMTSCSTCHR